MTISLHSEKSETGEPVRVEFQRYEIETQHTPHRYPVPHPFVPKVSKIGLAKILIGEVFDYKFKLLKSNYRKTLLSRPCIYGVFNSRFGGFSPIEERCVGCMRCVEEYPEVCQVDRNPAFTNFGDSYWMPDDPNKVSESPFGIVWYEAKTGKIQVKGMGYKGLFAAEGWDSMWTDMSEIVRPTRDGVYGREFISTQVDIGSRPSKLEFPIRKRITRITSIPVPVLFDYLPDNLLSTSVGKSIILAAKHTQIKYIFKPDQIDKLGLPVDDNLILYVDASSFGRIGSHISKASAILLDQTSVELLDRIKSIRSDIPVLVRMPLTERTYEQLEPLVEQKVDGFLLYADYHGRDWDGGQQFVKDLIADVHRKLVKAGTRDKVTLLSSGGIILAEHVPKAIIVGSDAVAINTSVLVALQAKFESSCRVGEEAMVTDLDFDSDWGGKRLINLLGSWHDQLIEIMSAMGIKEVRRLRGDTGRAMYKEELEEAAFGDITRID